jgi:hypothetical protein
MGSSVLDTGQTRWTGAEDEGKVFAVAIPDLVTEGRSPRERTGGQGQD